MRCKICDYSDNKEEQSLFYLGIQDEAQGRRSFNAEEVCSVCEESSDGLFDDEEEEELEEGECEEGCACSCG